MAIRVIEKNKYHQHLSTNKEKKQTYGEIFTPFSLIKDMFDILPSSAFSNPSVKWLDPGAGTGFFSIYLFWKLDEGLYSIIPEKEKRHDHIIKNMIHMVEIQQENAIALTKMFGTEANIYNEDFILFNTGDTFDYIIGNPPYNANGIKKVPTNILDEKKEDGKTIWVPFIKKAISLLKQNGNLLMIVPSIWMKPDRARTYHYLTSFKINKIRCFTNTETNKMFSFEAQTPTCYFWLQNRQSDYKQFISLYDRDQKSYINYPLVYEAPIPVFGAAVVAKLRPFVEAYGHIRTIKTNTPRMGSVFSDMQDSKHPYPNIRTAVLQGISPRLVVNYSNTPQAYYGECKLVLPHKMYGFPYIDADGSYGISNRDNYVIVGHSLEDLETLRQFFSTMTALYIFESTRYRMKYLERYAFEFIPDISRMPYMGSITDETIAIRFGLDDTDRTNIRNLHRKQYDFTYNKKI